MAKLYIFGDSYSTPGFFVNPEDSWWGLMANDLWNKIEAVDNYSWPGNNIDSIQHIIVSNKDMFCKDDYVVIGIPPIERLTVFENDAETKKAVRFDNSLNEISRHNIYCHSGLDQIAMHQAGRDYIKNWNRSWQEAQILRQMLTLRTWLDTVVDHCLLVNLSEPFQPFTQWSTLSPLQRQVAVLPEMIIFENTYYSFNKDVIKPEDFETHGWFGHHGTLGNHRWYQEVIKPCIKRLRWL